jgi:hypothetical protein
VTMRRAEGGVQAAGAREVLSRLITEGGRRSARFSRLFVPPNGGQVGEILGDDAAQRRERADGHAARWRVLRRPVFGPRGCDSATLHPHFPGGRGDYYIALAMGM